MPCRIGSTTRDVAARHSELIREEKVPRNSVIRIIATNLTYDEANRVERNEISICRTYNPNCVGFPGGIPVLGNTYSVYRIDW